MYFKLLQRIDGAKNPPDAADVIMRGSLYCKDVEKRAFYTFASSMFFW